MMYEIYTIGHSVHQLEAFIDLLKTHDISVVCDVRSSPYSKYTPQFNRETLKEDLKLNQISYLYLGKELGPQSNDPKCYINGKVVYDLIAATGLFNKGIKRLEKGIKKYKIAIMCAEKDPIICHRMILICRHLRSGEIAIKHIMDNGELESNNNAERRLMKMLKIPELTLFDQPENLIEQAYNRQSEKIAYKPAPITKKEIE